MKYIKKYEAFKNENSEPVNEEFLGKLIGGIKNLIKKGQKTKGGKEIDVIYQKYLNMITSELAKTAQVDLNVMAASKGDLPATAGATTNDANAKLAVDTLKKKKAVMDQIVQKIKAMALKEMDAVLAKFKGAAANPQLKILIDTKKDQFEMDYLNAQIAYLDKAGDKTMVAQISKDRDALSKKIEDDFKDFDTAKAVTYAVGDEVIYLLKDKKPEEYDKTKKPEDQKAVVGVHKIAELDGDNFTLEDEKGEPTIKKTGKEIMGKVEGSKPAEEYKISDNVIYKRGKFNEESWKKITDDDKKKPNEGPMKDLQDKEEIGIKKISKIEGDKVSFEDADFTKTMADILGKVEGQVEGEEDLQKKLVDLKDKPEELKKVSKYVDFMSDEKNKAKVEEIEKIIGEGEEEGQV